MKGRPMSDLWNSYWMSSCLLAWSADGVEQLRASLLAKCMKIALNARYNGTNVTTVRIEVQMTVHGPIM